MTKTNLTVLGVEDTKDGVPRKTATGKDYSRVNTNEGWMSCFNFEATKELKNYLNRAVSVEMTQKGDFKNITKFYGVAEGVEAVAVVVDQNTEIPVQKIPTIKSNGQSAMYVSYVKDLVVSGKDVNEAILIIKTAQASF